MVDIPAGAAATDVARPVPAKPATMARDRATTLADARIAHHSSLNSCSTNCRSPPDKACRFVLPDEDLPQYPAKMQELDWHTLRVNEATIARRIARAELILGSKLFHRTRGKLLPTETGQIVIQHAEHID